MARTIPAAHVVLDAHAIAQARAIYTTPIAALGGNANYLSAAWSPSQTVQCADGASNNQCTESSASGFVERYAIRYPVRALQPSLEVWARLKSANAPSGAATIAQIRTSSGTANLTGLPATAAAQSYAWYKTTSAGYSTAGDTDYATIALSSNVNGCGDVDMAQWVWSYGAASSLSAGKAGSFIAHDTEQTDADGSLAIKHWHEIGESLLDYHLTTTWPVVTLCDDLVSTKSRFSTTSGSWTRAIGPIPIHPMGGGVVEAVEFSCLAYGPAAADRVRVLVTRTEDPTVGVQPVIDSHAWTPAQTSAGATGTWYRTASNWEEDSVEVDPTARCYLWLEVMGDGATGRTSVYSFNAWAKVRS